MEHVRSNSRIWCLCTRFCFMFWCDTCTSGSSVEKSPECAYLKTKHFPWSRKSCAKIFLQCKISVLFFGAHCHFGGRGYYNYLVFVCVCVWTQLGGPGSSWVKQWLLVLADPHSAPSRRWRRTTGLLTAVWPSEQNLWHQSTDQRWRHNNLDLVLFIFRSGRTCQQDLVAGSQCVANAVLCHYAWSFLPVGYLSLIKCEYRSSKWS